MKTFSPSQFVISGAILCASLQLSSCNISDVLAQAKNTTLSDEDVINGLKTALVVGADSAQAIATDSIKGFLVNQAIQIALPEDAKTAVATLEKIGNFTNSLTPNNITNAYLSSSLYRKQNKQLSIPNFDIASTISQLANLNHLSSQLLHSINSAASYAAPKSKPIFGNAITSMSFTDAWGILKTDTKDSATRYLKVKTFYSLDSVFRPDVKNALDQVSATKYWSDFTSLYNNVVGSYKQNSQLLASIGLKPSQLYSEAPEPSQLNTIETDLPKYTTQGALRGLFYLVGNEENKIRDNPMGYAEDILQKVFGSLLDDSSKK